jgi:hypothetical protein
MSIELQFKKGSLALRVLLKDEALSDLQKIVFEYQSDEELPPLQAQVIPFSAPIAPPPAPVNGDTMAAARAWLSGHSAAEALNLIGWKTNPEKILILGAYHESKSPADEDWRSSDIMQRFSEAREQSPGNFTRDIGNAVKENLIAPATYRTYKVSRTGWNKLAEVTAGLANA